MKTFKEEVSGVIVKAVVVLLLLYPMIVYGAGIVYAGDSLLVEIKKAYSGIKDIKGSCKQISMIKDLDKKLEYSCHFLIKIPDKMHWKYEGQDVQEVYINGNEMIIYQEKLKQAIKNTYSMETFGQTPLALLSGLKDVEKNYEITEKDNVVHLIPKKAFFNIESFDVYPSGHAFPIEKIALYDKRGNEVLITLSDVTTNTGLGDDLFTFKAKEDVNIVDHR